MNQGLEVSESSSGWPVELHKPLCLPGREDRLRSQSLTRKRLWKESVPLRCVKQLAIYSAEGHELNADGERHAMGDCELVRTIIPVSWWPEVQGSEDNWHGILP